MSDGGHELLPRREFVKRAGATGLALSSAVWLAACGVKKSSSGGSGSSDTMKIGYVSPLTGEAASFGEPETYCPSRRSQDHRGRRHRRRRQARQDPDPSEGQPVEPADGLVGGQRPDQRRRCRLDARRPRPPRWSTRSSDACEAAGVPCISTVVPWESWYYGRGAKPGEQGCVQVHLPLLLRRWRTLRT